MPDTQVLLVLAIREAGLRSALAAQLALSGANLITTEDVDNPALLRGVRRPAVLGLDGATAAERPVAWIDGALDELRWLQIVLFAAAAKYKPHPKLLCLETKDAIRALGENIPRWREECALALFP